MKSYSIRRIDQVISEIENKYLELLERTPGDTTNALLFEKEMEEAIQQINRASLQHGYFPGKQPHRWYGPTKHFKWRLVYDVLDQEIVVIAAFYAGSSNLRYRTE